MKRIFGVLFTVLLLTVVLAGALSAAPQAYEASVFSVVPEAGSTVVIGPSGLITYTEVFNVEVGKEYFFQSRNWGESIASAEISGMTTQNVPQEAVFTRGPSNSTTKTWVDVSFVAETSEVTFSVTYRALTFGKLQVENFIREGDENSNIRSYWNVMHQLEYPNKAFLPEVFANSTH